MEYTRKQAGEFWSITDSTGFVVIRTRDAWYCKRQTRLLNILHEKNAGKFITSEEKVL